MRWQLIAWPNTALVLLCSAARQASPTQPRLQSSRLPLLPFPRRPPWAPFQKGPGVTPSCPLSCTSLCVQAFVIQQASANAAVKRQDDIAVSAPLQRILGATVETVETNKDVFKRPERLWLTVLLLNVDWHPLIHRKLVQISCNKKIGVEEIAALQKLKRVFNFLTGRVYEPDSYN